MLRRSLAFVIALGITTAHGRVWAQAEGTAPPTDLSRLVAAVERLVQVLESQAREREDRREFERLQVLVSVLSIRSRKVESLESDLRDLEAQDQSTRMELSQVKTQLEQLDLQETPASDPPKPEIKMVVRMYQNRQKELEDLLMKLEDRRVQAQNDLAAAKRRLAQLETRLEDWIDKAAGKP